MNQQIYYLDMDYIRPVFAVYSSFLQRSYDMLLHDVAIQNLHVVFGVDRAGLVGEDGETHHGVFDVAYLSSVPGMKILCPANYAELKAMLRHGILELDGPVAIRYSRGGEGAYRGLGGVTGSTVVREGTGLTIVTYGMMVNEALKAADLLEQRGKSVQVLKLNSIAPLDVEGVLACAKQTGALLVAEECVDAGCIGRRIASELAIAGAGDVRIRLANLGDRFIPQGSVAQLRALCGIDGESLSRTAMEVMN